MLKSYRKPVLLSLFGLGALALSANANMYLGAGLGAAGGIDGVDSGVAATFTFGYEMNSEARTRHGFELNLVGHAFKEDGYYRDDDLSIGFVLATYRVTHFFQTADSGLFGTAGVSLGLASVELEGPRGWDYKDSGIAAGRVFLGLGYAFDPRWRMQAAYSRFGLDDAEDHGRTFMSSGGYNSFDLSFTFLF